MKLVTSALVLSLSLMACSKSDKKLNGESNDNNKIQGNFASVTYIGTDLEDSKTSSDPGHMLNVYSINGNKMILAEIDLENKIYMVSNYDVLLDGETVTVIPTTHTCSENNPNYKSIIGNELATNMVVTEKSLTVTYKKSDTKEVMAKITEEDLKILQNKVEREFELLNGDNCSKESKTSDYNVESEAEILRIMNEFIAQ
ncbi:MAG: hypothetical protein V4596_12240 [Bdellovibrionota bacterium]